MSGAGPLERIARSGSRTIAVVTGARSEYFLLRGLIAKLRDRKVSVRIVATGSHFDERFGSTFRDLEADGTPIDAKVPLASHDGVARAIGEAVPALARALADLGAEIVVLLGDRFETFAAAQAAFVSKIPIAHIHGGESTFGAMDEAFRHCITKMATWHFAAAEPYARRIRQLGEDPRRVFRVGALGVDAALSLTPMARETLEARLGVPLRAPVLAVTYHPETLAGRSPESLANELLAALERIGDATIVFTGSNADEGGASLNRLFGGFCAQRPKTRAFHLSLGQIAYFGLLRHADAVVGNSSSGILEAPSFGLPTVDIGKRQGGRIAGESVLRCGESAREIEGAIREALSPEHRERARRAPSPYGGGGAADAIAEKLATVAIPSSLAKEFHDWPEP